MTSIREEYLQRLQEKKQRVVADAKQLLENRVLFVEKLDTATITNIVDAMEEVENSMKSVLPKLPSLRNALGQAEQELMNLVSTSKGANPKETSKMLVKALGFYKGISDFLRDDLSLLLRSRAFATSKANPDSPVGIKFTPVFKQALATVRPENWFKKLFSSEDIPYLDNNSFSSELTTLTFNELKKLTEVSSMPGVASETQVNQMASQAAQGANSDANQKLDLQTVFDKFDGPKGFVNFIKANELDQVPAGDALRIISNLMKTG